MFRRKRTTGTTIIELIFAVGLFVLLSTSLYQILRMVRTSFTHSRNKLDILQTTRIIMTGIRNELRNAHDKPVVYDDMLNIPLSTTETVVYFFKEENRLLYRGKKGAVSEQKPDPSEILP
jgi:type II secretory pathway component PulJ